MRARAAGLTAALFAGVPGLAFAAPVPEAPARQPPTIPVGIELVSVTVVVLDRDGRPLRGLTARDVELREDGIPQELTYFQEATPSAGAEAGERVPLTVVLVLDTSGSMRESLRFLQEAVISFAGKLEDEDRALLVSFNDSVKGSAEFSDDRDRLERLVEGLQAWGGTSLYDALHYALDRIKDRPGRKAVIVFSDGADTTSTLKDDHVVDAARSVEASIYAIGFTGSQGPPRGFLRRIASETGGLYFEPGKVGELLRVFGEISEELKNNYLLAYTPARPADGSWRRIELRVNRPGCRVRVRKGYLAAPRRRD
jgi:Ca-activated chloride channel family protein